MEKVRGLPGFGPDCKNCTRRIPDDYPNIQYPCGAIYFTDQRGLNGPPKITSDSEGDSFTCDSYKPKSTHFKDFVRRVSPIIRAIQSSLPQ